MEPIFTLPFPEYQVANKLRGLYKPKDGYSILLPLSRQQKGFDLLIYSSKSRKATSIQVKSSRSYPGSKNNDHQHYLWYTRFDFKKGVADFYLLFGVYPKSVSNKKRLDHSRKTSSYDYIYLLLKDKEMATLLNKIRTKTNKRSVFFEFGFDPADHKIFLTRGVAKEENYSSSLLENRLNMIKKFLKAGK